MKDHFKEDRLDEDGVDKRVECRASKWDNWTLENYRDIEIREDVKSNHIFVKNSKVVAVTNEEKVSELFASFAETIDEEQFTVQESEEDKETDLDCDIPIFFTMKKSPISHEEEIIWIKSNLIKKVMLKEEEGNKMALWRMVHGDTMVPIDVLEQIKLWNENIAHERDYEIFKLDCDFITTDEDFFKDHLKQCHGVTMPTTV